MMELEQRRVVITGGTSGIGAALALALAAAGCRVLVCGTNRERLARMQEVERVRAVSCDVTEAQDVRALSESVDVHLGGLDVLIHCAGIQRAVDVRETDLSEVERELDVNLLAPIRVTHELLPRMLASEDACIVNVTSVLAWAPKPSAPVYCASKAGFASWTTSLRYQLEGTPVRVMELVPPLVATPMTEGRAGDMIEPEQVAEACVAGLRGGATVVRVGKARLAHVLHRIAPGALARMMRSQ